MKIAFGKLVSESFCRKVIDMAKALQIPNPNYLMACMAFESGRTFSPSIGNQAGSGAVGLIQFMPSTALALGTSSVELAAMTAEQQLDVVLKYFSSRTGKLQTLSDIYMAILWPAAIGKAEDYVLFRKGDVAHPRRYVQNAGLDFNGDGIITKSEASQKVLAEFNRGLEDKYMREIASA